MTYKNTQPNSPKGQVFTAFEKNGETAARAKAEKLQIAAVRVNRWLSEWRDENGPDGYDEPPPEAKPPPAKTKAGKKARPAPEKGKERVFDVGEPNVHGTITEPGEQVSGVKWDKGEFRYVSNEKLRPALDEPSERDRFTAVHARDFLVMRKDNVVGKFPTFQKAVVEAGDDALWIFARTSGGGVALLQRPHWPFYEALLK